MEKRSFTHLNGCQLVTIEVNLTTLDPLKSEICEITCVPLNSQLEEFSEMNFFHALIRPERVIKPDPWVREAMQKGIDFETAFSAFHDWYRSLQLKPNWKLVPLCHDWPRIQNAFVKNIGYMNTLEYFKVEWARDINVIASFLNDRADIHIEDQIPFPQRQNLTVLASRYNIEIDEYLRYNTIYRCELIRRVYVKMIHHRETL